MNFNVILAILVLKNVITQQEADRLVEHLNNKPQSTQLSDAMIDVRDMLDAPASAAMADPIPPHIGPTQAAEEMAARQDPAYGQPTAPADGPGPSAPQAPDSSTTTDQGSLGAPADATDTTATEDDAGHQVNTVDESTGVANNADTADKKSAKKK